MAYFRIQGGTELKGEVTPQGAKNEALQVISAVLLTDREVEISNVPDILDVNKLIEMLGAMGVKVTKKEKGTFLFKADDIDPDYLLRPENRSRATELRGSIMLLGPLLARFGRGYMPKPGGDRIGRRKVDTHFEGFIALGGEFNYDSSTKFYSIKSKTRLKGANMLLDEASVTGTANILMAAVLAEGTTTIYNAACEPYIQQLCRMLISMGAKISGLSSNRLVIEGVEKLRGCKHRILPDMLDVGSWMGLAAMTRSDILIKDVSWENLGVIPRTFERLGIEIIRKGDDMHIPQQGIYEPKPFIDGSILTISDAPWPGFTPDLLSIILVLATQAKGNVLIHQKMFESRLFFVDKLIDMGANIILCDPHRASVMGTGRYHCLRGTSMSSPDIRAGNALLIAALSARGESTIHNVEQINRGYENIVGRLKALGAQIESGDNSSEPPLSTIYIK